jgi:cell wall-associated NlpC family hydrolase
VPGTAGFNDCNVVGFDCSGLTLNAYATVGLNLPHNAAQQWDLLQDYSVVAKGQPLTAAQPGDVIFFTGDDGTLTQPGHVGIYLGHGKMIQAPQSGEVITVTDITTPFWQSEFVGVADPYAYLAALHKGA